MTDQQTAPQPVADWLSGPVWVYFVAYIFNNRAGTGHGNMFISCPHPALEEDIKAFPATIIRTAEPGTQDVTVTSYNLVRAPAPDQGDLLEIAVQAAAAAAAGRSPVAGELAASIAGDPVFRANIAAAVAALAAAGHIR